MIASALMPIGNRASSVARDQRRHVRRAEDRGVALHAASSRARRSTASSIAAVSLPVNVFCWLGWKQPSSVHAARLAPRRRGRSAAAAAAARRPSARSRSAASQANAPRQTITRTRSSSASSRSSQCGAVVALGRQRLVGRRRAAHGGGDAAVAQREAVVARAPTSAGWRSPARCSAANRKSPERSPVNIRPVRLRAVRGRREPEQQHARGRVAEPRRRAGPSTPRRGTRRASRAPPARATRPAAGSGGTRRPRASSAASAAHGWRRRAACSSPRISRSTTGSSVADVPRLARCGSGARRARPPRRRSRTRRARTASRGDAAALGVVAVELVDVRRERVERAVAPLHRARAGADDLHEQRLRLVGEAGEHVEERLDDGAHARLRVRRRRARRRRRASPRSTASSRRRTAR